MEMNIPTNVVKLTETIWSIEQDFVRAYVIVGTEKALVLDYGFAPCAFLDLIRGITDKPLVAVLSHADGDHTGNLNAFGEVLLHPAEIPLLEDYAGRPVPIEDKALIELGGRTLQVLHIPGHTPGSIALYDPQSGDLFPGDTLSEESVCLFGRGRGITDFRDSLEYLSRYPVQTVWPAHGKTPITPESISGLLELTESVMRGDAVGAVVEDGHMPMPESVRRYANGPYSILY